MKALAAVLSVCLAIVLWYVLFRVAAGLAIALLFVLIVGIPVAGVAYAIYSFLFKRR